MSDLQELLSTLKKTDSFQQWSEIHPAGYLSHFFCQINAQFLPLSKWEVGFYEHSTGKITVFVLLDHGDAEIKPADDVFQKEKVAIEELKADNIKLTVEQAKQIWQEHFPEFFPREVLGDGFVVVQTLDKKPVWNFTFITKTIKFVNMKIDAAQGKVVSHEEISLVQK